MKLTTEREIPCDLHTFAAFLHVGPKVMEIGVAGSIILRLLN
jgi:hypothetical protein